LEFYRCDSYELLSNFINKFELDYGEFNFDEHFHSEGKLVQINLALKTLMNLSIWLPMKTIELITINKLKLNKPDFSKPEFERSIIGMTFKDLLTWYLEGEFNRNEKVIYKIKNQ